MRRRRARTDRGAAAVEFAFICIIFLTLVFGIIQYSMYFWSAQSATAAAREAARRAAVGDQNCSELVTAATSNVKLAVTGTVDASRSYFDPGVISGPSKAEGDVGDNVSVTITYNVVDFGFPFIPFASSAVSADAFARVENPTDDSVSCP
jgi:Flp pilus assembly protein TadG